MVNFSEFLKTALPDWSLLIGQKLVERAKLDNSNETFWMIIGQTVLPDRTKIG